MSDVLTAARASLNASLPATITTVDETGLPNVSYLSKVLYVDEEHIALTNQFFRKTRANLDATPHALLMVVDPTDGAHYQLTLEFEGSRTDGAIFEKLRAELDAIATIMGMSDVFRLTSADIFRVLQCVRLPLPDEE